MTTTVVAVFENADAADQAVRALRARDLAKDVTVLSRRQDGPEQGINPVITGPGYGQTASEEAPPGDDDPLGTGVAVGATVGGTLGMLAATYVVPGAGPLTSAAPVVSTVVGAGLGSWLGALFETGTKETIPHPGTVRLGGLLVVAVCAPEQADSCREVLRDMGALEVRQHPGGPVGEAENTRPAQTNRGGTLPGPTGTGQSAGQVAGGLALTGGDRRDTGPGAPFHSQTPSPHETDTGLPKESGQSQPGPGSGAGVG